MKINKVVSDVKKFSPLTIFLLCILVIVLVFWKFQPTLWPGGYGIGKGESVLTKTIEKDKQGKIVKTIETIKYDDGKTLWDWGSLFIVPLSLAILGFFLQQQQQKRAEQFSREQQERADKLSEEQRKVADNETKEEVLQTYFDRLSVLLIDKNLIVLASKDKNISKEEKELLDSSIDIIRARTLSIFRRFKNDVERTSSVINFLIETEIITKLKLDLSGAKLSGADLSKVNLCEANLSGAKLSGADLSEASLCLANLSGADLSEANLCVVSLRGANLRKADLRKANLNEAHLHVADLIKANLCEADLSEALLIQANLREVNLCRANLSGVDLGEANLWKADLGEANLSEADFRGTKHLTVEQVKSARNWESAKYDDDFREKLGLPPSTQEQL